MDEFAQALPRSNPDAPIAATGARARRGALDGLAPLHNPAIGGTTGAGLALSDALLTTCDGAVLWRIADDALQRRACALAGRELTEHEQRRFLRASGRVLCPRE